MIKKNKTWTIEKDSSDKDIEMEFDFSRHNFMARGGEVYYLHILQVLQTSAPNDRVLLENLLRHLVTANSEDFSKLANWIYDSWLENQNIKEDDLWISKTMGFIPATDILDCGK